MLSNHPDRARRLERRAPSFPIFQVLELSGVYQTTTTALHCLTSLLTAAARGSGVVQFCVGQLLPGLIEYIARAAEADYQPGDPKLVALAEVLKSFVGVLTAVGPQHRSSSPPLTFDAY